MDAKSILTALQVLSWTILDELKVDREPRRPVCRTRKWDDGQGPQGIAYHYTGGAVGERSIRWFNDPSWGNRGSSAQFLIFDRVVKGPIGDLWLQHAGELLQLFPVPTILLADWRWSTWCTNWTNAWTVGVENRNCGRAPYDWRSVGKPPVTVGGHQWEPYTYEQLVCNINIGRVFRALRGDQFDPDWVVGHSSVWASKSDPGPLFPLHLIRRAIFDDVPIEQISWLHAYRTAVGEEDQEMHLLCTDSRDTDVETEPHVMTSATDDIDQQVADQLYLLGLNAGPEIISAARFKKFVTWFQRSTRGYVELKQPERVLQVTGRVDSATKSALSRRLRDLQLVP